MIESWKLYNLTGRQDDVSPSASVLQTNEAHQLRKRLLTKYFRANTIQRRKHNFVLPRSQTPGPYLYVYSINATAPAPDVYRAGILRAN
jgi:hypothetical protein